MRSHHADVEVLVRPRARLNGVRQSRVTEATATTATTITAVDRYGFELAVTVLRESIERGRFENYSRSDPSLAALYALSSDSERLRRERKTAPPMISPAMAMPQFGL